MHYINDLIVKQELPATATNLITTTPRTSCIYFLPKIHKPNNPGRPIASACSCPTELISSYLDKIMAPIARSLSSYVNDYPGAKGFFRVGGGDRIERRSRDGKSRNREKKTSSTNG